MVNENWLLLYKNLKALIILILSFVLFHLFDVSQLLPFIPENTLSFNIALYTILLTLLMEIPERKVNSKKMEIKVTLSLNNHNDDFVVRPIIVNKETPTRVFVFVEIYGLNKNKKINRNLKLKFPYSVTVQHEDNSLIPNERNELNIVLDDYINTDGRHRMSLHLLQEQKSISSDAKIEPEISTKGFDWLFVNFSTKKYDVTDK